MNSVSSEPALYIHIPFCKSKCFYCDFPSYPCMENYMNDYVKALCKEIETIKHIRFKTIFIGGGTPTYLSKECLVMLKDAVIKVNKTPECEFTVEGNPGTFEEEKLKILKDMGVNRLSIGLQVFDNRLLKNIGRIHTVEDFIKSFSMARKLNFKNINVDIMFGLPGQRLSDFKNTLREIITFSPEHISCYSLILEEGTLLYNLVEKNKVTLPTEDEEREMYYFALDYLKLNGYKQYEISNFAKEGKECKHNLVYWNLEEYIGVGAGAHSYYKNKRRSNTAKINEYINGVLHENSQIKEEHINSIEDNMEEFMFMGLRKIEGISMAEFNKKFNKDIESIYSNEIEKYIDNGLLKKEGDRLYLTSRGIELSNEVMSSFILTV